MARGTRYSSEVKERAVRLVLDSLDDYPSKWAAIRSIAEKVGCGPETLRKWVRKAEDADKPEVQRTEADKARIKELEREVFELQRANEILRKASAFFAQAELDRPSKKW